MTYYPLMRSKQFEMIAIRELAETLPDDSPVVPIIEPVREITSKPSIRTLQKWTQQDRRASIILNPTVGDIERINLDELQDELGESFERIIPAINLTKDGIQQVDRLVQEARHESLIAIVSNPEQMRDLSSLNSNLEHVSLLVDSGIRTRSIRKMFPGNRMLKLSDPFVKESRNSDYEDLAEDYFSDDPYFFASDGYDGFSDYLTIGSTYAEGGFMPRAVALHWTITRGEEIYVKHFVSESRVSMGETKEKYNQAARKLAGYIEAEDLRNPAAQEFLAQQKSGKFPGLGVVKKISIKNHIEIINSEMASRRS